MKTLEYKINPELREIMSKEPMFELFKHADYYCVIQRHNYFGNYLGYVGVDENHPCYNLSYDGTTSEEFDKRMNEFRNKLSTATEAKDIPGAFSGMSQPTEYYTFGGIKIQNVDVHGGITYAKGTLHGINDDILDKLWWFGFDTLHPGDMHLFINSLTSSFNEGTYKDLEYTRKEVKSLAEQLKQIHIDYVNQPLIPDQNTQEL